MAYCEYLEAGLTLVGSTVDVLCVEEKFSTWVRTAAALNKRNNDAR